MSNTELPSGWILVRLEEVAEITGGIQKQQKRRPVDNAYPFLRVANVGRGALDLEDVHKIELFDGEIERFRLQVGDLLVVEGNGSPSQIGRAASWRGAIDDAVHQNHLIRVRPGPAIDPNFLESVWNSPFVWDQLREVAQTTSGLYTLSTAKIKRVRVPLPPLHEQRRIVEALDGYLSRMDAAVGLVASSSRRSKALQRSLLQQALKSCTEYPMATLGSLIREPLRNGHSARASDSADGIRTINLTAVTTGEFSEQNSKVTVADAYRVRDLWLRPGDILIQRSNTPDLVGTAALYAGSEDWAIYPDLLIRVRVNDRILPEFAVAMLRSPQLRRYFRSAAKGLAGSMPKIDQAAILGALLPVPPLDVQREIVKRISALSGQVELLAAEVERGLRRAQHLRLSVLRSAFAGDLVPQDSSDESLRDLVDSIQRERAKPRSRAVARSQHSRPEEANPRKLQTPAESEADSVSLPQSAVQQEFEL
ncbi:restriction endonuclease subunit S [Streptomyces wedmorensis]|uniref:Restriction endonuclease subunit S n=1 Tax=Streptomyces wedmorensis TaxID=43759 RepID=A0ABW6IRU0_STRWE